MISCEKAAIICNKAQYKEATVFEKLTLKIHILLCNACAAHAKNNAALTSLCNKANLKALTDKDKTKMKEKLEEQV